MLEQPGATHPAARQLGLDPKSGRAVALETGFADMLRDPVRLRAAPAAQRAAGATADRRMLGIAETALRALPFSMRPTKGAEEVACP